MAEHERYPTEMEAADQSDEGHEKIVDNSNLSHTTNNELKIRLFTLDETMYWGREGTPTVIQCSQIPLRSPRRCFRHGGEHNESFDRLVKTLLDHAVVISQPSEAAGDTEDGQAGERGIEDEVVNEATDVTSKSNDQDMASGIKNDVVDQQPSVSSISVISDIIHNVIIDGITNGKDVIVTNYCEGGLQNNMADKPCEMGSECDLAEACLSAQKDVVSNSFGIMNQSEDHSSSDPSPSDLSNSDSLPSNPLPSDSSSSDPSTSDSLPTDPSTSDSLPSDPSPCDITYESSAGCHRELMIEDNVAVWESDHGSCWKEMETNVGKESSRQSTETNVGKESNRQPTVSELRPLVEKLINERFDEICCSCIDDYCNTEDFDCKGEATVIDAEAFELRVEAVHTAYINVTNAATMSASRTSLAPGGAVRRLLSHDDERFIEFTFRECLRYTDLRLFRLTVLIVTMLHVVAAHFNAIQDQIKQDQEQEECNPVLLEEPMFTSTAEIYLCTPSNTSSTVVLDDFQNHRVKSLFA